MNHVVKKFMTVCACGALAFTNLTPAFAKGDIIRPYTFGFGSKDEVDEGVYELVEKGDLKHLTFKDSKEHALNYWIHVPKDVNGNAIENLPMVVYMHGYSDGGGDNNIAIRYHNALLFRLIEQQNDPTRQAIIVVPQTPFGINPEKDKDWLADQWVGIEPREGEDLWTQWNRETWNMDQTPRTENLNTVVELLKNVQNTYKADKNRAYVSGISMGGYTTWDLISRDDSHMFAAAVPICGVGDPTKVENAKDTPIRMFHGGIDPVINNKASRIMYEAVRKYGNATFTIYEDEEHPCWNSAYSPVLDDNKNGVSNLDDLIAWMFNQSLEGTLDGSVDKAPLQQIINDAKAQVKDDYSKENWDQLQAQITVSEKALDPSVNKEETVKAIQDLDQLMNKVEVSADKEAAKEPAKKEEAKENNSSMGLGITVGVVAIVVLGFVAVKMKNNKK